ncbi:trigger factor [Namhaeicola litoreus]|uniref:Trigger factor n=1 Tax=Namhaeicola litoreus TaxID=1052145 RepID=A0ABW3XZ87_9FLAO
MNITKEDIDQLNSIVRIDITADDYKDKVENVLKDYRIKANIPGFRKGHVPMSLVKKQYGKSVMIDEVNKLLQDALGNYLVEEKLDVLGNPLPKIKEDFSWDADDFSFEFELGLAPEFEVNLKPKKAIKVYKIIADDKMIDDQIIRIREQYGKIIQKDSVEEGDNVTVTFENEEKEINKKSTLKLDDFKGKANAKKFLGKKVGEVVELKSKGLFEDDHNLIKVLGVTHDDAHGLDVPLKATIDEISKTELADLNQELFDKVFGEGNVKDEAEFRAKLKEDAENQFKQQADQHMLNAVTESLIENTKFELPVEFLQKWLAVAGEKSLSDEEAKEEYQKSEKGLRYQLIENKLSKDNGIQISYDDLKDYTKGFIKTQMAQYGQMNPEESELDDIANRVLGNQQEAKRLSEQLMNEKLLNFFRENVNLDVTEVNFEDFIKEVYK